LSTVADDKPWDARLAARLVAPLAHSRVTPNHLTTLRLLFGILACGALAMGTYLWCIIGTLCFATSHFLDHTDGELARVSGKSSRFGHYYDLISDALAYILLFAGIGIGQRHGALGDLAIALGLLAGVAVAAIFQMRLQIENRIGHDDARQPHFGSVEIEDVMYALPLVAIAGQMPRFLVLAAVGAPLFSLWVLREYLALRRAPAS
jgi:phosphatidylglycerophosphate synthase